jgi:hypothetical protein
MIKPEVLKSLLLEMEDKDLINKISLINLEDFKVWEDKEDKELIWVVLVLKIF